MEANAPENTSRTPAPIIAVTANALEDSVKANLAAGANAVLEKPISPRSLYDALAAVMSGRRSRVERTALRA